MDADDDEPTQVDIMDFDRMNEGLRAVLAQLGVLIDAREESDADRPELMSSGDRLAGIRWRSGSM